jgi:glycosyltransferase involved in cell wall biosynthesis
MKQNRLHLRRLSHVREQKTGGTEHADAAAEPLTKACPADRRQTPKAARQPLGRTADGLEPEVGWSTDRTLQEHGWTEDLEDVRRQHRVNKNESRLGTVSVVIPCYNQGHFLGEAIESVLNQSYPHFEIIVVDDGSKDNTSEVATRYPGVCLVRQENRGLAGARNAGLHRSRGEYVIFLDADDRLLPDALKAGLKCFEAHPECAFVSGHYREISTEGAALPTTWKQPHIKENHYAEILRCNYIITPAVVMHRLTVVDSVGGFDTSSSVRGSEDSDLCLRIARDFPVYCHGKLVAEYRIHGTSMSHNFAKMLKSTTTVRRSQRQHVKGNKQYEKAIKEGVRVSQDYYGNPFVSELRVYAQEGKWKRTVQGILVLLRYHPRGLALLLLSERRLERRRLARHLHARKQELEAHERRLKELEGTQESESTLAELLEEQRQKVLWLRQRIQKLERAIQRRDGKVWKSLKRLVRLRASVGEMTKKGITKDHGRAGNAEVARRSLLSESQKERSTDAARPLVTVVIPCYNQGHFLGEAIESILNQSYPHFEVIVVDDGSTDDTSEVAARYPGVRCVRQDNQGLAAARNTGLRCSNGSYLVFLDADDRLLSGALEAGLECFEAHPECAFVYGRSKRFTRNDSYPMGRPQQHLEGDPYFGLLCAGRSFLVPTVMYRRSVLEFVGGFDSSLNACEDYDLYYRITRDFPICYHETFVAEIRAHEANMTRDSALMLSTSINVIRAQRKYLRGNKQYEEAYRAGIRWEQGNYGYTLVEEVRAYIRGCEWKRALRGVLVLLRYYPRGLALVSLNERHLERRKLARQLLIRKQSLEILEQRLRKSEGTRKPGSALGALLEEQREEVLWLRERIQKLERRMQNLDQRSQTRRNGKTRKPLKRLASIRATRGK